MPKLVIIVEDSEPVASSLSIAIEEMEGVRAVVAHHPLTALRFVQASEEKISALITDLNLPSIDGYDLIAQIRHLDGYQDLPAIMITADESRTAPANGSRLGLPNASLQKPCSMKEVRRVLQSLLG
jgi:DNA-binding response OmpR family regulator